MTENAVDRAIKLFREHHGFLRMQQASRLGISPRTLYRMQDNGLVVRESRGIYRLADVEPGVNNDLVQVALGIPKGIICLISALMFHGLTTQIPRQVFVALPIDAEKPRLEYPPLRLFWMSQNAYSAGIDTHVLEGIPVKIYGVEKTVADSFKFRNKTGLDIALEALREYRKTEGFNVERLLYYARIDRVERIIKPYLEAML